MWSMTTIEQRFASDQFTSAEELDESLTYYIRCAGCATKTEIEPSRGLEDESVNQQLARGASYVGYRLVPTLGWTCGVCLLTIATTEISGAIHAETDR